MNSKAESASLMEALVAAVREDRLETADSLLPQMGWLDQDARKAVIEAAVISDSSDVLYWAVGQGFDPLSDQELAESSLLMAAIHGCSKSVAWILEQAGDNFYQQQTLNKALCFACEGEISSLLMKAGADFREMDSEERGRATGWLKQSSLHFVQVDEPEKVSYEEFLRAMHPRFSISNPEEADEPYWTACIKDRVMFDAASEESASATHNQEDSAPFWSHWRYGQSLTYLPDGRVIEIAGEHEEFYDPDFCIYNDVFVHVPGKSVRVFLYPESVFPPTSYHSATLVGNLIYIVGSFGSASLRRNQVVTPVYRLDLNSMAISKVETSGEMPGWISGHSAILSLPEEITVSGGKVIQGEALVPFEGAYTLNLETMVWRRREAGDE